MEMHLQIQVINLIQTLQVEPIHHTRNYGVGTGVTCLISSVPRNIHTTATTNKFTRYDATTPYGSHNNQRISYTPALNIMGTSATTSQVDEDNILVSSLGTGSGNAIRVNAGATGDTPSPISTTFNSSATPAVYEATVRGGTLRHDQTNYSDGILCLLVLIYHQVEVAHNISNVD